MTHASLDPRGSGRPPRPESSLPVQPRLGAALALGALLWVVALLAAPVALHGGAGLATAAALVYQGAGLICHQRPERSFYLAGVQLPVCARCLGLYVSGAAAALAACAGWQRPVAVPRATRRTLALASVPTALTVAVELAGLAHPSNTMRAIAAVPLGAAAGWIFVRSLRAEAGPRSVAL